MDVHTANCSRWILHEVRLTKFVTRLTQFAMRLTQLTTRLTQFVISVVYILWLFFDKTMSACWLSRHCSSFYLRSLWRYALSKPSGLSRCSSYVMWSPLTNFCDVRPLSYDRFWHGSVRESLTVKWVQPPPHLIVCTAKSVYAAYNFIPVSHNSSRKYFPASLFHSSVYFSNKWNTWWVSTLWSLPDMKHTLTLLHTFSKWD